MFNVHYKTLVYVNFLISILSSSIIHTGAAQNIRSFFGAYTYEENSTKEYHLTKPGTLTLHLDEGNIIIANTWKKNTICVCERKRANKKIYLPLMNIHATITNKEITVGNTIDNITLTTRYHDEYIKGCIDYELIIPENMHLDLQTDSGSIVVNEVQGTINAKTVTGNITINKASDIVDASVEEQGSITIKQALGNVNAITQKGNIAIDEAHKSIITRTENGSITLTCSQTPTTSRIIAATSKGSITLGLPGTTNASIYGKANRGMITSDHYITLKQYRTQLNHKAWQRFKQEVSGILGNGEAEINITTAYGNITITNTSVS